MSEETNIPDMDAEVENIINGYIAVDGGWKPKVGNGRRITTQALRQEIGNLAPNASIPATSTFDLLHAVMLADSAPVDTSELPRTTWDWLKWYMQQPGTPYDVNFEKWEYHNRNTDTAYTTAEMNSILMTHLEEYNVSIPMVMNQQTGQQKKAFDKLPSGNLSHALERYKAELRMQDLIETQDRIRHIPNLEIDDILNDMIEVYQWLGDPAMIKTAIVHWMWQVKRKIFGKYAKDHLVISLHGKQGAGKSTLLRFLSKPLGRKGFSSTDLSQTKANFDVQSLVTQSHIVDIEELADPDSTGSGHAITQGHTAKIKSLISSDRIDGRMMYGAGSQQITVTATFACTTNKHIYDVVIDKGYRRFFEIDSSIEAPSAEKFEEMTKLSTMYVKLWQSIDENNERGYLRADKAVYDKIVKLQHSWVRETNIQKWLKSFGRLTNARGTEDTVEKYSMEKLYGKFKQWYLKTSGKDTQFGLDGFCAELEEECGKRIHSPGTHKPKQEYYWFPWKAEDEEEV